MNTKKRQDRVLLDNVQYFSEVARLLAEGHSVTIPAKGRSMLPFIIGGRDSLVLVAAGSLCVGDIVLARLPERGYVLHRVYRLSGDSLTLMGDGNLRAVERCRAGDVVGKAVAILRRTSACGLCLVCGTAEGPVVASPLAVAPLSLMGCCAAWIFRSGFIIQFCKQYHLSDAPTECPCK